MNKQKKISVSDFRAPAMMEANKEADRVVLGKVGGIATGIAEHTTPKGDVIVGLRGAFRFVSPSEESVIAPVLWLPGDHDGNVKERLGAMGEGAEIKFLYEIAALRQDAVPGYVYEVLPLLDIEVYEAPKVDPLASMFNDRAAPVDKARKVK